jgi:hypothetical protein
VKDNSETVSALLCPSAQPEMQGSVIFGVIGGSAEQPRVGYLAVPRPVAGEPLVATLPVHPTEVFRIAAPCAGTACQHFDGANCTLVTRTVQLLPPVSSDAPPCAIRQTCRWWMQEGKQACVRCPQIVTRMYEPTDAQRLAAMPNL